MFSLWFYSFFFKEIKIGNWQKMPENLCILTEKMVNGEQTTGRIFRPTPQVSIFMTILISAICWGFMYVIFFVFYSNFIRDVFAGNRNALLMLALFVLLSIYFFYYTFLSYLIFPKWLEKKLNHYFIYVGPEGIIRKDYWRLAFIPWPIVSGAAVSHSYIGGDDVNLSLDLYLKNNRVWSPMLINSYAYGSLWCGLVTYRIDDMRLIANNINLYAKEIGFKIT